MTRNQIGSTEQRLALNVCYGIIGTVGIAILGRGLGVGRSVLPWVLYAIFATPMIVMLSHRELFGALPSNRGILYANDCGARDLPPVSPNRIWRVIITAAFLARGDQKRLDSKGELFGNRSVSQRRVRLRGNLQAIF